MCTVSRYPAIESETMTHTLEVPYVSTRIYLVATGYIFTFARYPTTQSEAVTHMLEVPHLSTRTYPPIE